MWIFLLLSTLWKEINFLSGWNEACIMTGRIWKFFLLMSRDSVNWLAFVNFLIIILDGKKKYFPEFPLPTKIKIGNVLIDLFRYKNASIHSFWSPRILFFCDFDWLFDCWYEIYKIYYSTFFLFLFNRKKDFRLIFLILNWRVSFFCRLEKSFLGQFSIYNLIVSDMC